MKAYTAAPPDVLRVDEKNLREHAILNCCGVILTTNHKTDGIYLPAADRRHYVAWSELTKEDFEAAYWTDLYAWYAARRRIPRRDRPIGVQPQGATAEDLGILGNRRRLAGPEDGDLADVLERLRHPDTVTLQQIIQIAPEPFGDWLRDRRNSCLIPHRLEDCGYVAVRCNSTKDGRCKVDAKNQVIYANADLPLRNRIAAAILRAGHRSV